MPEIPQFVWRTPRPGQDALTFESRLYAGGQPSSATLIFSCEAANRSQDNILCGSPGPWLSQRCNASIAITAVPSLVGITHWLWKMRTRDMQTWSSLRVQRRISPNLHFANSFQRKEYHKSSYLPTGHTLREKCFNPGSNL